MKVFQQMSQGNNNRGGCSGGNGKKKGNQRKGGWNNQKKKKNNTVNKKNKPKEMKLHLRSNRTDVEPSTTVLEHLENYLKIKIADVGNEVAESIRTRKVYDF